MNSYRGELWGPTISTETSLTDALQKIIDTSPLSKFYEGTNNEGEQFFFASSVLPNIGAGTLTFQQGACVNGTGTIDVKQNLTLTKV